MSHRVKAPPVLYCILVDNHVFGRWSI
jgi:hypothetical protein